MYAGAKGDISIHAPAKGATHIQVMLPHLSRHFNPRSREGSDSLSQNMQMHTLIFQSTLPRRERQSYEYRKKYNEYISIHAPAKGATCITFFSARAISFQSTLPRRERLSSSLYRSGSSIISIHAPAKGATRYGGWHTVQRFISIHAPAKGATLRERYTFLSRTFQSTLPRRERHWLR